MVCKCFFKSVNNYPRFLSSSKVYTMHSLILLTFFFFFFLQLKIVFFNPAIKESSKKPKNQKKKKKTNSMGYFFFFYQILFDKIRFDLDRRSISNHSSYTK